MEPPNFDLRDRRTKNHQKSSDLKNEQPAFISSTYDIRPRRSNNRPSSIFGPTERSEDRAEDRGRRILQRWRCVSSKMERVSWIFRFRRTNDPAICLFIFKLDERRPSIFPAGLGRKNGEPPSSSSSAPPSDQHSTELSHLF